MQSILYIHETQDEMRECSGRMQITAPNRPLDIHYCLVA